ncbi:hypothetical protein K6L44_06535 [Gluconacetobacter entanii]|uniref:hypothetical protein n=1 Tax=Gluconacetobacter entanii TaxID=108528 RepID=UPI001C933201|nr:hypothetical protein [Gluconacetobacter entanii]MBY4639658.1 hypothetical protein [Gluconacetobacter entanii]MCW4579646.1 hypothetical protein [Gluconacetobacter entanii]MCW4583052.1 hypothetical protein [Gluconacetobacter entanii]MCW4586443.1 hypothetical protein [Gluconacetobacter entanii]
MSGSVTPTGPLTEAERVLARRYCGFSIMGPNNRSFAGYRFFQSYGMLEYRLTNMTDEELSQTRTYLTQISTLETAILGASDNLDTDQAAVWHHNRAEVQDRMGLFNRWRKQLCQFLGVPPGPGLRPQSAIII